MREPDSGDLLLVGAGDDAAFDRLLSRWKKPVYQFFERTREPSAATELTAELFFQLHSTAGKYDPAISYPVWHWRLAARIEGDQEAEAMPPIPAARLADSASARTAFTRAALMALPPAERNALLLTRQARLPLASAARALEVSEVELRRQLVRAMEQLTLRLAPIFELPAAVAGPASKEGTP
jgi:RNA polymerase sigma-70 factor, ECF subfamily